MHLHVIICFALIIWWPEQRPFGTLVESPGWTCLVVWGQAAVLFLAAAVVSNRAVHRLQSADRGPERAQHLYHRGTTHLRRAAVAGFAAAMFLTSWVDLVRGNGLLAAVPGVADLVIVLPFLVAATLVFVGTYPIDRALHRAANTPVRGAAAASPAAWSLPAYLLFNVRHHLLVVAVPMILILAAFDLARDHEPWLQQLFQIQWAAEAVPAVAAGVVFVFAPVMLRYIWPTKVLPDGRLRRRLQAICADIGLKYRDILVWRSEGLMVNAAMMGLFPSVRYILLSDGLLESMTAEQIEAVFGHEAGHIRHRHIPFFALFAICSMLLLSAAVEAMRLGVEHGLFHLDALVIEGIAFVFILAFWWVAFGWLSRLFERQSDLFGARCVTPTDASACHRPCAIHDHSRTDPPPTALCATAAAVFASALDRVAILNGIPHEERSWRHPSIASRIRSLAALAGDPNLVRSLERQVRRLKIALLAFAVVGTLVAVAYVWHHPIYGIGVGAQRAESVRSTCPTVRPATANHDHVSTDHRRQGPGRAHPPPGSRPGRAPRP